MSHSLVGYNMLTIHNHPNWQPPDCVTGVSLLGTEVVDSCCSGLPKRLPNCGNQKFSKFVATLYGFYTFSYSWSSKKDIFCKSQRSTVNLSSCFAMVFPRPCLLPCDARRTSHELVIFHWPGMETVSESSARIARTQS